MTREEAVEVLKERYLTCVGIGLDNHANRVNEAIDMAIEALSAEATEVVRCKDCKHLRLDSDFVEGRYCSIRNVNGGGFCKDEDFCSYGKRRENGET